MDNKLTIWNVVKDVSTALTNVVNTYSILRTLPQKDIITLNMKIKAFQAKTYAQESAILIRLNIEEIAATQKFIDQQNLNGYALELAMEQLSELSVLLKRNLECLHR